VSALARMVARERAARGAPSDVIIWADNDDDGQARIDAARANGQIGPRTRVSLVQWLPTLDGVSPEPDSVTSGVTAVARIAALRMKKGGNNVDA
jgi:hypothetical protein